MVCFYVRGSKQWGILLVVISNCSYQAGLKLRKLVINDQVYVFRRVVSGDGGRVVGHWNNMYIPVWGNFVVRFKCRKMRWPSKGEFLSKQFCGTLHQLLNTSGWIFDTCLIRFSHKIAEIHFLCIQLVDQQVRSTES